MRSSCTLSLYNIKAYCILYTDACEEGGGCIIVQLQPDGKETVVAFGSCTFSKAQKRYHISRKEALAFIWALGHFHLYLSTKPFLWRTDHRALKFIFDASKTGILALQRYKLIADSYQFTTEWIPGAKMIADTMSRLCIVPAEGTSTMTNFEMVSLDIPSLLPPHNSPDEAVTDIAFFNYMDEEELIVEDDPARNKDEQSDNSDDEEARQQGDEEEGSRRGRKRRRRRRSLSSILTTNPFIITKPSCMANSSSMYPVSPLTSADSLPPPLIFVISSPILRP